MTLQPAMGISTFQRVIAMGISTFQGTCMKNDKVLNEFISAKNSGVMIVACDDGLDS